MGIHDRDYYRHEGPSFLGSLVERGTVCKWLIGINIAVFLLQVLTRTPVDSESLHRFPQFSEPLTDWLCLDASKVLHGQVWRLLTAAFLHDTHGIGHILFNMFALWVFGVTVEETRGKWEFLAFYLAAAVAASVVFVLASPQVLHLQNGSLGLGASGAVMAVMVLSAFYNPRQVVYLFFLLPIPIWFFIGFLVLNDLFPLLGKIETGVGNSAHLGGAAFAYLYYKLEWHLIGWTPALNWRWSRGRRGRSGLRLFEADDLTPLDAIQRERPESNEGLTAEVDRILEKISRVGAENLTESEKEVLLRASEAIRRRSGSRRG
jgi:membrane associated rhomboid family serine protease